MVDKPMVDALAPVRAALRSAALAETDQLLAAVAEQAEAELSAARAQAMAIIDQARAEGAADAAVALAGTRARARRRARSTVMRARRDAYRALVAAGRAGVRRLRDEPGHPELVNRLAAAARARLGPAAAVWQDGHGGVLAEAGGRRLDFSMDGFADRAVATLGAELEGLWEP